MTAEEALDLLLACKLKVGIQGASAEDFREFQENTGLKWKNGDDLYGSLSERYTNGGWYICREQHCSEPSCLALSRNIAESYTLKMSEFLDLPRVKIDESEFEEMFYDC